MQNANVYLSTFAAGFESLTAQFLIEDFAPACIRVMSGAVVFESDAIPGDIQKIKYLKNSYLVINEYQNIKNIQAAADATIPNKIHVPKLARTFRLDLTEKNRLVSLPGPQKARLISSLERATGLKYDRRADMDMLLSLRDDGGAFLLQKITRNQEAPDKGQLEPHVANLMVRVSRPEQDDVFIDSFCGSGAIQLARAFAAPYKGIFALDVDDELVQSLKAKVKAIKNSRLQKLFFC